MAGAVEQRAVEGALVKNRRHVAVWRQRRPQLGVDLPHVAGVGTVEPCGFTKTLTALKSNPNNATDVTNPV